MSTCRRNVRRPLVLTALALTTGLVSTSASAAGPAAPTDRPGARSTFLGDAPALPDVDTRAVVAPTTAVRAAVAALHPDVAVSWNSFGTPASLTVQGGGDLASGLSTDAVTAARSWLTANRAAFGLSLAEVQGLELVNDAVLPGSDAHAVLLRQKWGAANAVEGGLVAVGTAGGRIVSVTSSLAPGLSLNTAVPVLTPLQAVLTAARNAGFGALQLTDLALGAVLNGTSLTKDSAGFTLVTAQGLSGAQRTRLAVLPTAAGARLVYETDVLDVAEGRALATMTFVDAVTGAVLVRRDAVDTLATGAGVPKAAAITSAGMLAAPSAPSTFSTAFTPTGCGTATALAVPAGTRQISLVGAADVPTNDVDVQVLRNGVLLASSDTGGGQEVVTATLPAASTATDRFTVQACPSPAPLAPAFLAPYTVTGTYTTDPDAAPATGSTQSVGVPYAPTWKYFQDSPNLTTGTAPDADVRTTACWTTDQNDPAVNKDLSGCQEDVGSDASKQPWDVDARTALPTFTTTGNNAFTADARLGSTLTPGATAYQPKSLTRDYQAPFTDDWHKSGCDPTHLTPTGGDLDASITNLFVGHNIMHDFSYRLGFTERGYGLQASNRGLTGPTQENDPELGNVQSGALTNEAVVVASGTTGQALPVTGRDNANQIALQDGVPGITNQYLFQPLLGFYGPCSDGDLDFSIFGHEYTHAISNRMVAGPDTGLSGAQAGSMGESWSDLDALEAMHELGIAGKRGEDPESVGAYATGNTDRGIRDFALTRNPLNYGDIGFDATGAEVHADGEVWNGVQWAVRDALVKAHPEAPATDAALQRACATGRTTAGTLSSPASGFTGCPGNRRWIQYVFDSFLLQASGTPSFVDMKDAMIAAATLRGGNDAKVMAKAFAQRGLGADAVSNGGEDTDPTAGYASPVAADNGTVAFSLKDSVTGAPVAGEVYIGQFQARVTPYLTTTGAAVTKTMAGGAYDVLVRANGYGLQRRVLQVTPGTTSAFAVSLARNVASAASGATITGDGVRLGNLIDDDEATNGAYDGSATSTPIAGKSFTVDLHGTKSLQRFSVSALHHPADANVAGDVQGRLLGVRGLDLQVSSDGGATYRTVYTKDDFFPATAPRTVAPDLVLRDAVLSAPVNADHVRLVVKSNQCTGAPAFRGDQDNDPLNNADCTVTPNAYKVSVTELQAFGPSAAGFLGGAQATGLARLAPAPTTTPTPAPSPSPSPTNGGGKKK